MSDALPRVLSIDTWSRNIPPATKYSTIFAGRNTHILHLASGHSPEDTEVLANVMTQVPQMVALIQGMVEGEDRHALTANAQRIWIEFKL